MMTSEVEARGSGCGQGQKGRNGLAEQAGATLESRSPESGRRTTQVVYAECSAWCLISSKNRIVINPAVAAIVENQKLFLPKT